VNRGPTVLLCRSKYWYALFHRLYGVRCLPSTLQLTYIWNWLLHFRPLSPQHYLRPSKVWNSRKHGILLGASASVTLNWNSVLATCPKFTFLAPQRSPGCQRKILSVSFVYWPCMFRLGA
jgi:hypothetical protein